MGFLVGILSFVLVAAGVFAWWPENKFDAIAFGIGGAIGSFLTFYVLYLLGVLIF